MPLMNPEQFKQCWGSVDWDEYERRVQELEAEGIDRSDAQGIVDLEIETEFRERILGAP